VKVAIVARTQQDEQEGIWIAHTCWLRPRYIGLLRGLRGLTEVQKCDGVVEARWTGVIGSITHCDSYTAAAGARQDQFLTLGIDAELNQPLPEGVLALIASPREQAALIQLNDPAIRWDRLMFSAKASVFKVWFPVTKQWIDFLAADLAIDPVQFTFRAELRAENPLIGGMLEGRFVLCGAHLLTAMALAVP
jgi:4'-phosphopantetheinyl transferase EntD